MSCLTLCVPTDSWEHVFEEVYRVLAPGGRLELIEDTIIFPPQPPITLPFHFESLFEQMLSKTYGISLHPETFISQMMKDIFGYGELVEVMHLSLAHRDPPTEEDRDEAAAASETERNPTTGLLLLPSTFLPMEAEELEMHTTRHMRTLLSCKHKLAEHAIETAAQEDVNDEVVQEALYEYERCVCLVLHNPRFC
jgi:SAM-dependent methyltransferase